MHYNKIYFTRVRRVRKPQRNNPTDAGVDFMVPFINEGLLADIQKANPNNSTFSFIEDKVANEKLFIICVQPGGRVLIPSGVRVKFDPHESMLVNLNKSGLSSKHGIVVTAQVVDSEYSGEIHLGVLNNSDNYLHIRSDMKIAQFIHVPVFLSELSEISNDQYEEMVKDFSRGTAGIGSSQEHKED